MEVCSSEQEKVRIISYWIAKNVKYDARAYVKDNRNQRTPRVNLRRRKTMCQGYAELFNELCRHANLESEMIVGYDKGAAYELGDTMVRDDHAWNAVRIDDEWHVLDLSWMAGYLEEKPRAFRRWLYFKFGINYRRRYRFVHQTQERYYLPDPKLFVRDHLAAHPWWQLLDHPVPIEVFHQKTDSLEPFFAQFDSVRVGRYAFEDTIRIYRYMDKPDVYLRTAERAFAFNPDNHRILAEGHSLFAAEYGGAVAMSGMSWDDKITAYDSTIVHLKLAATNFRAYANDCRSEWKRRRAKNRAYDKYVIGWAGSWMKSNRKWLTTTRRYKDKLSRSKQNLRKEASRMQSEAPRYETKQISSPGNPRELPPSAYVILSRTQEHLKQTNDSLAPRLEIQHSWVGDTLPLYQSQGPAFLKDFEQRSTLARQKLGSVVQTSWYFDWNSSPEYRVAQGQLVIEHDTVLERRGAFEQWQFEGVLGLQKNMKRFHRENRSAFKDGMKDLRVIQKLDTAAVDHAAAFDSTKTNLVTYDREHAEGQLQFVSFLGGEQGRAEGTKGWLKKELVSLRMVQKSERKRWRWFNRYYFLFYLREKKKAERAVILSRRSITSIRREINRCKIEKRKEEEKARREE